MSREQKLGYLARMADKLFEESLGHVVPRHSPKPKYPKNDTSAASKRITELLLKETADRLNLSVPAELKPSLDDVAARYAAKNGNRHLPLRMGDPEGWRSVAGGWEQIGNVDPSGVERWSGNVYTKEITPPSYRTPLWTKAGPPRPTHNRATIAGAVSSLHGCKFACGVPGDADFHFCNKPIARGQYCREHAALCYLRGP